MQGAVLLLEDQAQRCLKLAHQCQNKKVGRILRLLAVDLMIEVEHHQRADLAAQFAELRQSAKTATAEALAQGSRPEMLAQLQALRLIVRADTRAVEFVGAR